MRVDLRPPSGTRYRLSTKVCYASQGRNLKVQVTLHEEPSFDEPRPRDESDKMIEERLAKARRGHRREFIVSPDGTIRS